MCWQTLVPENVKPRIAFEDIPVYKVLNKDLATPYMRYPIKFDEPLIKVEIVVNDSICLSKIEEGYHAYISNLNYYLDCYAIKTLSLNTDIGEYVYPISYVNDLYNAFIPKGTKYWINERGETVSESLVVSEKIIQPQIQDRPLIDILVMKNDKPRLIKIPYNKLAEIDDILGVVIGIDSFSSKVLFVSMLKDDWIPRTTQEYVKYSKSINPALPKDCKIDSEFGYDFCVNGDSQWYRFFEIIHGKVDWLQPFFNFNFQNFKLCGSHENEKKYSKGYIIPVYSCKIPIPIE